MNYQDFIDAGFRVFGLHGVDKKGVCMCGNPRCEALFKHPIAANWQHTPDWSDEQLETMELTGQFDNGFANLILCHLIVDVDERNGGAESWARLCDDIPQVTGAGLIVRTGSGGQSKHLYFSLPREMALRQKLEQYPGIDFKSSGFVVGPGSKHISGNRYEILVGSPHDIGPAPEALLKLLEKPKHIRAQHNGVAIDVEEKDIVDMLSHLSPDCDYDTWVRVAFAIHHATGGVGFDLWDEWSSGGADYPGRDALQRKWHSIGKSASPVTIGTLISMAREAGWQESVTFESDIVFDDDSGGIDFAGVDLTRPPGFVGRLVEWINGQCLYPREHLAVAAALSAVGNICGLRMIDGLDGMTLNIVAFCVAGSSTGKEAVQQAYIRIMKEAGLTPTIHGDMKSQQEVIRNLLRHQAANYLIDELGIQLQRIVNSQKKGGASYLEGLLGVIMSAYSKADGFMPVGGDVREEVKKILLAELRSAQKAVDDNEGDDSRVQQLLRALENIDSGLERPFLSMLGFTTPVTFNNIVDFEQATNGFVSRALIFNELETNPKRKTDFKKMPMDDDMKLILASMANPGEFSLEPVGRIEFYGERASIATTGAARAMLDEIYSEFWKMSEQHKSNSGLEAIPRRGYELCAKVSAILGAPEGVRDVEHVRYAYALTKRDIDQKLRLAYANMKQAQDENLDAVCARIMNAIAADHGEPAGVLRNRCRPHKKEIVDKAIEKLLQAGMICQKEEIHAGNKRRIVKYFLC